MQDETLVLERRDDRAALLSPVQSAHDNPKIEFRDGQFLFSTTNEAGGVIEQFRSAAAVKEAFSGIPVDSGWLQPEIVRWGDGRYGEWAVAFFPPGRFLLEISNEGTGEEYAATRVSVPMPGLVFFGIGVMYYVFAVKTAKLDPYQEVFRVPLPNVYQSGEVCWGLIKPPRMTALSLFQAWQLFMTSTFNNHLANGKAKSYRDDVRALLLKELHAGGASEFPVKELIRQVDVTGITLDQLIKAYFETGKVPS